MTPTVFLRRSETEIELGRFDKALEVIAEGIVFTLQIDFDQSVESAVVLLSHLIHMKESSLDVIHDAHVFFCFLRSQNFPQRALPVAKESRLLASTKVKLKKNCHLIKGITKHHLIGLQRPHPFCVFLMRNKPPLNRGTVAIPLLRFSRDKDTTHLPLLSGGLLRTMFSSSRLCDIKID